MGFLDELRAVVPLFPASAAGDRSGVTGDGLPLAVARPDTVDGVRAVLRLASAHGVPVVPRGAGTGLAGGAVAGRGELVLDVSGLNRIVEVDPVDALAVVEPGVRTAELDRAAQGFGLRYAPDPASAEISTIGGNIATNAGGMRCVKYGVTRNAVLGLDVVLADGRLIRTGRRTVKGVAGLDLTSLFVGSEGTLGVVVGATLRLRPLPARTLTAAAAFDSVAAAARACAELTRQRREPSVLELLDGATLAVIDRAQGTDLAARGDALVIAQADGPAAEEEITAIAKVLAEEATWSEWSDDAESAERLLFARRMALPSIERFGRALIEDICVPRSRLAEAFAGVSRIAAAHGVRIYSFAHAGDGNLHPIVGYETLDAAVRRAGDDLFALALDLGGTVTGEHGVGLLKRDWLAREAGPEVLDVQAAVKTALDPQGILNPGKAF
ncbi:FAD-binding oxidoreductase [Amycolatopsis sp. ATCC 39116]|uniref:FAD-binding oxidoreductase n=1 Tax=Amycolatopsis sp. (strain ATCC 39116 / 75iv2) TaxID=385957 RepID=UPI0002626CDA|nr:FAD-linked oxidase C-terminal domain-containing protein [Amycolatopsis sp. ATCC 39116]